jgi:hypothetical protein
VSSYLCWIQSTLYWAIILPYLDLLHTRYIHHRPHTGSPLDYSKDGVGSVIFSLNADNQLACKNLKQTVVKTKQSAGLRANVL